VKPLWLINKQGREADKAFMASPASLDFVFEVVEAATKKQDKKLARILKGRR
jgi:hypothetical protein